MAHVQLFLSTVSAEFRSYRDALRHDLDRPNVTVKVQEDFIATGSFTPGQEVRDLLPMVVGVYSLRWNAGAVRLVGPMTSYVILPQTATLRGLTLCWACK